MVQSGAHGRTQPAASEMALPVITETPKPEPHRLYVIGDIHGRLDLLDRMLAAIDRDLPPSLAADCLTVTVGDYIDRGSDSRGVVDRLARNPFPTEFIALRGNHEDLLKGFLDDPPVLDLWRRLGGLETLHSYGVDVTAVMHGKNYDGAAEAMRAALPPLHSAFFDSLRVSLTVGRYFLCHAGVRPGIALSRQSHDDLMWIREGFLDSTADFGKIVVHGHTPTETPDVRSNRINVDTGAFITGRLTCAVLEERQARFLTTD